VTLQLGIDMRVDLTPVFELYCRSSIDFKVAQWVHSGQFRERVEDGCFVHIVTLLCRCTHARPKHVLSQLVWTLALMIEVELLRRLKTGSTLPQHFVVKVAELWACLQDRRRLACELRKHVAAVVLALRSCRNVSSACDKANVGGLQLQSAIYANSDNDVVVSPPQVPRAYQARLNS